MEYRSNFRFLSFTPTSFSSSAKLQMNPLAPISNFLVDEYGLFEWESAPFSGLPQCLEVKLENRAEVAHLILLAKQRDAAASTMEIYVGDTREDRLGRVESAGIEYRLAAKVEGGKMPSAVNPTQIDLLGIG